MLQRLQPTGLHLLHLSPVIESYQGIQVSDTMRKTNEPGGQVM